jgi:6-phosphogluconolactonase
VILPEKYAENDTGMMKTRTFLICLPVFFIFSSLSRSGEGIIKDKSGKSDCYIYISVNKEKKIVIFKLDPLRGELVFNGELNLTGTPGSLCADPSQKRIYAALRDINSVASLRIERRSGNLIHLKDTPVADNPVYISTDKKGKYLFFTSYNGNKNAVYPIGRKGVVGTPVQVIDARINPHMIKSDASGKYVFVPNKGGDVVQQFVFQRNGILKANNPEEVSVKSASGPRHFTINPAGDIMYVVNELSCTVVAFHLDRKAGILSGPFQEITTKPGDFTSYNTCADIHITPDGRFLYASNRGHDSLAGFSIDAESGRLTQTGWFPTEKEPREFEIDPSGQFVISAGESSGGIALYRIQNDGSLSLLKTYSVGQWPVWVKAIIL